MSMENERRIKEFWARFLRDTGRKQDTPWDECFAFGDSPEMADELLALVLAGKKRATSSGLPAIEAEGGRPPRPGDLFLILDGSGGPGCVIETTAVTILPFKSVTWQQAKREGEDETLESWQEEHVRFFTGDAQTLGYTFSWDMPIAFADFEVVYPVKTPG